MSDKFFTGVNIGLALAFLCRFNRSTPDSPYAIFNLLMVVANCGLAAMRIL